MKKNHKKLFRAALRWLEQCHTVESSMYPIIYPLIHLGVCCYFGRQIMLQSQRFPSNEKPTMLGEFQRLLGRARIRKENLSTSNGTTNDSCINKNMVKMDHVLSDLWVFSTSKPRDVIGDKTSIERKYLKHMEKL